MRYRRRVDNSPRTIVVKYAGKCACCGGVIPVGAMADYDPAKKRIAHVGGLDGNSGRCYAELKKQQDPGFVDLDRMFEDSCADICGR